MLPAFDRVSPLAGGGPSGSGGLREPPPLGRSTSGVGSLSVSSSPLSSSSPSVSISSLVGGGGTDLRLGSSSRLVLSPSEGTTEARDDPAPVAIGSRAIPELRERRALICLAELTSRSDANSLAPATSQVALISLPMNSHAEHPEHHESPSAEGTCLHFAQTEGLGISLEQQATFGRNIRKY